jgi:hypothetical protein
LPSPARRTRIATIAVGVLVFVLLAASCDNGSSNAGKSSTKKKSGSALATDVGVNPVGPEKAVAQYLRSQGLEYAGDCATAQLPRDKGKWCSTLLQGADNDETKVYGIGPVGSKYVKVITVNRHGNAHLTPGGQVGVANGNVGTPQELSVDQIAADPFISSNLILDQLAGIGHGLSDITSSASTPGGPPTGGTGGGTGGGVGVPTVSDANAGPGVAAYTPVSVITVTNPNVQVLGEVAFRGSGCSPNEPLAVLLDGVNAGTINANAVGDFAGSLTVPKGTTPGAHSLTVRGAVCVLDATVMVEGALAFTGASSHTSTYVLGALAAIVMGLVLVVSTRRRRGSIMGGGSSSPPSLA